jgi:NAD(P)-dependent dehydrogenase (short-subunit alcohol dehydrogenase family)
MPLSHSPRAQSRRVLVTGSGTGIGREIALEFGREGANVILHYSHSAEGARTAVQEIRQAGGKAAALQADFNSVEETRQLARQAIEFLGGLDVLVNNAGITMNRPFEEVTPEQYDTLYNVNIRAPFFLTQAALPALIESGGSVINLTSIHAFQGNPEHAVYAGTKGAIVAWTRELAIELAPKGVRVNAIAPGAVVVENYYRAIPDYDPEAAGREIPCGFVGEPRDIARVAVFLASDDARFIIGQTLIVDGGTTSWMPFSDAFRHPSPYQFGRGYVPGL